MPKPTPFPLTDKEIARFWAKVDRSGGPDACWPWRARVSTTGYGVFSCSRPGVGSKHGAHRIAYTIANGRSIQDELVCHACDNPVCCNPAHLWTGTDADNRRDAAAKGRAKGNPNPKPFPSDAKARGENHHKAKLTVNDVREIRRLYRAGEVGYYRLAQQFGVSPMNIKAIVTGRTWKDVA